MRVPLLAALALGLALWFEAPGGSGGRTQEPPARARTVVVAARGPGLAAARWPGGEERLASGIYVDGQSFWQPTLRHGLRALVLDAELEVREERGFDVASTPEEARAFLDWLERLEPGSVLALGSSGRVKPVPEHEAEARLLTEGVRALGAETPVFEATPASWALLCVRLEGGWVNLAESYSQARGVSLVFAVQRPLGRYAGHRPEVVRLEYAGELRLEEELVTAQAAPREATLLSADQAVVAGEGRAALYLPPGASGVGRVRWGPLRLGRGARFHALVGLLEGGWAATAAVRFTLTIDGAPVESLLLRRDPAPPGGWVPFEVDLAAFAGERVQLELMVEAAPGEPAWALWGEPRLYSGGGKEKRSRQ